jgi:hypothetical protein
MTLRKCLTPFLILLIFSFSVPLVYAGDGSDIPVLEHPWEEVKRPQPPIIRNPDLTPSTSQVYIFSSPLLNSGVIIVVVKEKSQEVVNKDVSVKNVSLPRKK